MRVLACGLCGSDVEKIGGLRPGPSRTRSRGASRRWGTRGSAAPPALRRVRALPGRARVDLRGVRRTDDRPGGFAEQVGRDDGVELPDAIDDATGTYVEPLACVLRGAERVPRGRVLVVGHGFVGRLFAEVLSRRGDEVFAIDSNPERTGRAPDGPVDAAVLCAPAAPLDAVAPGGTVLVFAERGAGRLDDVYRRELTLTGSRSSTPRHMEEAAALLPASTSPTDRAPARALRRRARPLSLRPRAQGRLHAMRALRFYGPGDLRLEEVPKPEPVPATCSSRSRSL